jgi:hypothetical protein
LIDESFLFYLPSEQDSGALEFCSPPPEITASTLIRTRWCRFPLLLLVISPSLSRLLIHDICAGLDFSGLLCRFFHCI